MYIHTHVIYFLNLYIFGSIHAIKSLFVQVSGGNQKYISVLHASNLSIISTYIHHQKISKYKQKY
jgi:hypothetical protein